MPRGLKRPGSRRANLPPSDISPGWIEIDHLDVGSERALALFRSGFYEEAVQRAAQALLNDLKERAGRDDLDGEALFNQAFSAQNPLLQFSERATRLERDQHDGFRHLGVGMTRYLRNVVTHGEEFDLDARKALIWLAFISALREDLQLARPVSPGPGDRGTA